RNATVRRADTGCRTANITQWPAVLVSRPARCPSSSASKGSAAHLNVPFRRPYIRLGLHDWDTARGTGAVAISRRGSEKAQKNCTSKGAKRAGSECTEK